MFLHQFLYALPRKEGYEFFLGQWAGQELHFTSLINVQVKSSADGLSYIPVYGLLSLKAHCWFSFQTLGENASSQLILYHYSDLKQDKDIVLMTAEMDSKFIVSSTLKCLANTVGKGIVWLIVKFIVKILFMEFVLW